MFYSFEGNTRFIVNAIAESINADILELKPKKELTTKGFMKYVWGGRQVLFKKRPDLMPFDKNPEDYDIVFIGTPVWAYTYAPTLRAFFSKIHLKNKKIALFCCHGGGMKKTLENMEELLSENNIVGKIDFLRPLDNDKEANRKKAINWAIKLIADITEDTA